MRMRAARPMDGEAYIASVDLSSKPAADAAAEQGRGRRICPQRDRQIDSPPRRTVRSETWHGHVMADARRRSLLGCYT
ncbi:hypothetical protein ACHAWF_015230, partial [Thalassiosira exigua]